MATIVPGTYSSSLSASIGTINANDAVIIQDSTISFTSGLDLSAVEVESFAVAPTCLSSFGSASAGAVLLDLAGTTTNRGLLDYNGRGSVSYWTPTTVFAVAKIRDTGGGTFYGVGGDWNQVEQSAGQTRFNSTADVQIIYLTGGSSFIDVHASDTIDTAVVEPGAYLHFKRTVGALTVRGNALMDERAPVATTLNLNGDGRLVWAGGDIGTINISGRAVLDLSMCSDDVTITTSNKTGNMCRIIKPTGAFALTITNENLIGDATSDK